MASDSRSRMESNRCSLLATPVELICTALSFLDVAELDLTRTLSLGLCQVGNMDTLWQPMCTRQWADKSRLATAPWRDPSLTSPWRTRYVEAEHDSRRCSFRAPAELHALTFDFRFRSHPDEPQGRNFRFNPDGRVSGHPNGCTYEWRLLNKGKEVMLGQYPTGWVRRLASWGWAVCNVNIVCLSIEPGVDGEPELAVSTTAAAAAEAGANAADVDESRSASDPRARRGGAAAGEEEEDEDTVVDRPARARERIESSRDGSTGSSSCSSSSSSSSSSAIAPSKAEANRHLFEEEPYGSDDHVQVTLPDGSTVAMPEYLYRAILSEQRRIQRRLGEWPLDGESDSDSDDAYESEPTSD